ncbi:hypothetical protein [uncultured Bacteroides sp.]|uniref:hypothetical protein n=1 Tax=uncultured Bacteroides sp. TaxID=162156 RepID=UPI002608C66E|nr:hypothetical protein [uncultured Bacteroides sp.]
MGKWVKIMIFTFFLLIINVIIGSEFHASEKNQEDSHHFKEQPIQAQLEPSHDPIEQALDHILNQNEMEISAQITFILTSPNYNPKSTIRSSAASRQNITDINTSNKIYGRQRVHTKRKTDAYYYIYTLKKIII